MARASFSRTPMAAAELGVYRRHASVRIRGYRCAEPRVSPGRRARVVSARADSPDPPRGFGLVSRSELLTRLDGAFGVRLTTVTAGAGFGKSTLLATWAADLRCAWHTVTVRDRALDSLA